MASKSLKRFRGRLIFCIIFLLWWKGVFAGEFAKSGVQNVVFLWQIVVDLW
jgi:hypothetical protein